MTNPATDERISYRPAELAEATGLSEEFLRTSARTGLIPRLPNTGKAVVIPRWAVQAWHETGEWNHPAYRPQPRCITTNDDEGPAGVTAEPSTQTETGTRS